MRCRALLASAAAVAVAGALLQYDPITGAVLAAANASIAATPQVDAYPANGNVNGSLGWAYSKYSGWTSGFFPGLLWKLYNITSHAGDTATAAFLQSQANARTWPINPEQFDTGTHDVGFMVYNSFGVQWRMTGNTTARAIALNAAASLATRFVPVVGAFRSWGSPNAQHTMETIADNMINLELLWWAGQETGNTTLVDMAHSHARKMIADLYQPFNPGCAWHLITYDDSTGAILNRSSTPQGLGLDTVWSRGQAWTINGFAIAYRYTQAPEYLAQAVAAADCFIRLTTLCCATDEYRWMPLWDFNTTAPANTVDTSAAMIAAAGMIELSWALPAPARNTYLAFGFRLITSAFGFWSFPSGMTDAVLRNGTVTYPLTGIPIIYGDYYLLEAWTRWTETPAAWREEALASLGGGSA